MCEHSGRMGEFQLDLNQILSLVGAALVLSAFLANSFGRMKNDSFLYAILNFLGTGLLALSVLSPLNLGILIVEVIWAGASLGLCFRAIRRRTKKIRRVEVSSLATPDPAGFLAPENCSND